MRDGLIKAAIVLAFFGLGFFVGNKFLHNEPGVVEVVKVDTLVCYDTVIVERPVQKLVYLDRVDTIEVETIQHDTVLAELPIERKVYAEDSLYYASVSGFRPSLDTLIVYPKTTTITIDRTKYVQPPKWSFGITAGPSALITPSGKIYGGVGIAAGISYNF